MVIRENYVAHPSRTHPQPTSQRSVFCNAPHIPPPPSPQSFKTVVGETDARRLFDAQSCLELRLARFLSLGRWLWRGKEPSLGRFPENSGSVAAAAEAASMGQTETGVRGCDGSARAGRPGGLKGGSSGGIWVPWETEVANASPGFLKVKRLSMKEACVPW